MKFGVVLEFGCLCACPEVFGTLPAPGEQRGQGRNCRCARGIGNGTFRGQPDTARKSGMNGSFTPDRMGVPELGKALLIHPTSALGRNSRYQWQLDVSSWNLGL